MPDVIYDREAESVRVQAAFAEPFEVREVRWKPQQVKTNRCMAMCYIDARLVMDRLDDVVGAENWEDAYMVLPDGSVSCRLTVRIAGRAVTKEDVGSPSEQPDLGDRLKAAYSDSLKRAAVKFGIGRYLYRLGSSWVDYDPVKKQIVQPPQLPVWAVPKSKAPAPAPKRADPAPPKNKSADPAPPAPPATGEELRRRLSDYDAKLAGQKLIPAGALIAHVTQAAVRAGFTPNMAEWTGPAIEFAVDEAMKHDKAVRARPART